MILIFFSFLLFSASLLFSSLHAVNTANAVKAVNAVIDQLVLKNVQVLFELLIQLPLPSVFSFMNSCKQAYGTAFHLFLLFFLSLTLSSLFTFFKYRDHQTK